METERAKRLAEFVSWVGANIRGDEKGEAQVYLDRFFQAFGHAGVREAGATLEDRIKKTDGKGTAFADLVWKPVVLIEMKKRGEDLTRHYRQAFDYWIRLVPGRPRHPSPGGVALFRVSHQGEGIDDAGTIEGSPAGSSGRASAHCSNGDVRLGAREAVAP